MIVLVFAASREGFTVSIDSGNGQWLFGHAVAVESVAAAVLSFSGPPQPRRLGPLAMVHLQRVAAPMAEASHRVPVGHTATATSSDGANQAAPPEPEPPNREA